MLLLLLAYRRMGKSKLFALPLFLWPSLYTYTDTTYSMCLLAGRGGVSSDERKEPMLVISQSLGKTSNVLFWCYGVGLREWFV